MATITPMTLQDLQDAIQVLYEGNPQTPDSGDDDYISRTALINQWVNRWEMDNGVLWDELWATTTATVTTATTYSAPTDFKFANGPILLISPTTGNITKVEIVDQEKVSLLPTDTVYAYFTGNPNAGYTLNLNGLTVNDTGKTIKYHYYKFATKLDAPGSKPDMTDPYMIVYGVVANLFNNDGNDTAYVNHLQQAEERLGQMEIRNMMQPQYMDTSIDDFYPGFGL